MTGTLASTTLESKIRDAMAGAIADVSAAEARGVALASARRSNRSKRFVARLGEGLSDGRVYGMTRDAVRGFYLDKSQVRPSLASGHGEFLWDIFVGAPLAGGDTFLLGRGLLALESELKNSQSKLRRDFEKLLVAQVETRVFVMPALREGPKRYTLLGEFDQQAHRAQAQCWVIEVPPLKAWSDATGSDHPLRSRCVGPSL